MAGFCGRFLWQVFPESADLCCNLLMEAGMSLWKVKMQMEQKDWGIVRMYQ